MGTPNMVEGGVVHDLLLGGKYGHKLHVWDLGKRRHKQAIDLGAEHQMVLELRPAHDPTKPYGFVGVVVSTADLSASVWLWHPDANGGVAAKKVITIPAEPAETEQLPAALQPFGAVPPLITDIALSVDDKALFVSCWGTGELKRFDVSDPHNPTSTSPTTASGPTRCACKGATRRLTPTASRDRRGALAHARRARRLPRPEPRDGLTVRGLPGPAAPQPQGGAS